MTLDIGNYAKHAKFWDWGGNDRTAEHDYWYNYANRYGESVLIPMCALGETAAYMAKRGLRVTAFDITPEMISEAKKRFGDVQGLRFSEGDVRDFRLNIAPADFCFCVDFGHLPTIDDVKKALVHINFHLRDGGCLVIETGLRMPDAQSAVHPQKTFYPQAQVYPGLKVWKTGEGRYDAETGRQYISQTFYAQNEAGNIESFDHAFYLQGYYREEWLAAFAECGFDVVSERGDREVESWQSGDSFRIFELVKSTAAKRRYSPTVSLEHLQTPIYRYENVALYNDFINLEQPNNGLCQHYRFDINAVGEWVGFIHVWLGYSVKIRYCGQIGYGIKEQFRNRGYMTKACLALKPFLRECGFKYASITTDENNAASRRVCEKIGATLIETVDTPTWTGMYSEGQRRTCVYEWRVEDAYEANTPAIKLRHQRINMQTDMQYVLERHCRINYECDTPWVRRKPYEQYRADWFANAEQQKGFLDALNESVSDDKSIAEIIKTGAGETVGYLWMAFHAEDASFIWADVQDIYVEAAFRESGVAAYLMEYAEEWAKQNGAKVIRSGTGCENVKSQRMHRKLGYYQYRFEYEKLLQEDNEIG